MAQVGILDEGSILVGLWQVVISLKGADGTRPESRYGGPSGTNGMQLDTLHTESDDD